MDKENPSSCSNKFLRYVCNVLSPFKSSFLYTRSKCRKKSTLKVSLGNFDLNSKIPTYFDSKVLKLDAVECGINEVCGDGISVSAVESDKDQYVWDESIYYQESCDPGGTIMKGCNKTDCSVLPFYKCTSPLSRGPSNCKKSTTGRWKFINDFPDLRRYVILAILCIM